MHFTCGAKCSNSLCSSTLPSSLLCSSHWLVLGTSPYSAQRSSPFTLPTAQWKHSLLPLTPSSCQVWGWSWWHARETWELSAKVHWQLAVLCSVEKPQRCLRCYYWLLSFSDEAGGFLFVFDLWQLVIILQMLSVMVLNHWWQPSPRATAQNMLEGPCLLAKGQCKPSLSSAGKMAQKEHHRESEPRPWCSVGLSAIRTPWHSNAVSALWFLLVMTGTPALETLGFKCFYQHIQPKKTGWLI